MEIKEWLSKHGKRVSQYVIIDDMNNMFPEQQSHYIQTNAEVGITIDGAQKVISFLNNV